MNARFFRVVGYLLFELAALFALAYVRRADVAKVRAEHLYCQWFHDQWHEYEWVKGLVAQGTGGAPKVVAFIGDSSTMDLRDGHTAEQEYGTIARRHLDDLGIGLWMIRAYGNAIDTEYLLADQMIVRRPQAAVLIVNLQAFSDRFSFFRHPDRAHWIALSTVPEALWLPLEDAGVAASELLLGPLIRMARLCEASDAAGAFRELFRARFGFRGPDVVVPAARVEDRYPTALDRSYWGVQVYEAFVRKFERAGIPLLVVIQPVHVELLKETGGYERLGIDSSLNLLKEIAERHGAGVLDLSELLPEAQFYDTATHFTIEGTVAVADATGKGLRDFVLRRARRVGS